MLGILKIYIYHFLHLSKQMEVYLKFSFSQFYTSKKDCLNLKYPLFSFDVISLRGVPVLY